MADKEYGIQKYFDKGSNLPAKYYEQKEHFKAVVKAEIYDLKEIRPRITQAKIDELLCRIKESW